MARTHRWDGVTAEDRLLAKTLPGEMWEDGTRCWVWQPKTNSGGYGGFWLDGRHMMAHRAAYIIYRGPIPDGLEIDHLCRNRACVNPFHLEAVERRTNLRRGIGFVATHARQTHCKRGHEFTLENTRVTKRGERNCRTCYAAREWGRRHGLTVDEALVVRTPGKRLYVHTKVADVAEHMAMIEARKD